MAYDVYSTQKVFSSEMVNILCNKVLDHVHTTFTGYETKLVATDGLARILQGVLTYPLPVVAFVTNDATLYDYLVKNLRNIIQLQTQISFENRIQIVTSYGNFEFWYNATYLNSVIVNGIYCRDINEL